MIIGAPCYEAGVTPYIIFRCVPAPTHPLNECTACIVEVMAPDTNVTTYTSPDATLSSTTHFEEIDGVTTKITEWVFTFPTPLTGSKRRPWYVHFEGTAGVLGVHTTLHYVNPSVFP